VHHLTNAKRHLTIVYYIWLKILKQKTLQTFSSKLSNNFNDKKDLLIANKYSSEIYHSEMNTISTYFAFSGNPCLYKATTAAPPSPRLCCSPTFAPFTWRFPAIPLNCQHNSEHWAKPEIIKP